jgi:hypothetical protein
LQRPHKTIEHLRFMINNKNAIVCFHGSPIFVALASPTPKIFSPTVLLTRVRANGSNNLCCS